MVLAPSRPHASPLKPQAARHRRTAEPFKTLSPAEAAAVRPHPALLIPPPQAVQSLALAGTMLRYVECSKCGKQVCESAVVTFKKVERWNGDFVVRRRFYCDHCDHIQFWLQKAASDGALYDVVIDGPGHITKKTIITNFLRVHPESVGVTQ